MQVKVLTYNVWGMPWGSKHLHEILLWLFCQSGAEIICLQEVFSKHQRMIIESKAKAAHWQAFFPNDPCLAGTCFNAFHSGSGLCILVSPSIEVLNEIPFIPYQAVDAYIEKLVKKGFFGLQLRKDETTFSVVNTHLIADVTECRPLRIPHFRARRLQEKQLVETVKSFRGPTLIAGDFNQEEHHYLHRMYENEDWTFLDTFEQIDHVVCLPTEASQFSVTNVHFFQDIHYSDHIPLRVDIQINSK